MITLHVSPPGVLWSIIAVYCQASRDRVTRIARSLTRYTVILIGSVVESRSARAAGMDALPVDVSTATFLICCTVVVEV